MLACLITHSGDRELTVNLAEHIARLGGVQNHECLIVTPQETNLEGIEGPLRVAFGKVHLLRYHETLQGWPYGPNEACEFAMMHIWTNPELQYHYLMLEPDCVPKEQWLNYIDLEYRRCGAPILGTKIDTTEVGTNRVVGKHVIGVAVYPNNFPAICPLVRTLRATAMGYRQQNVMPMPWDCYLGPYTSKMCAETQSIFHLARVGQKTEKGLRWDCSSLENAIQQSVGTRAVLIHGCKNPEFLRSVTGTPQYAHAPREEKHQPEYLGVPQRTEVREDRPETREIDRQQGGNRGSDERQPKRVLTKVEQRQLREREELRKELGIAAPIDTPQFRRAIFFHTESKNIWREYAKKLGIAQHGGGKHGSRKKCDVINDIVALEESQRREPWTKELPPPAPVPVEEAPLPPVTHPVGLSNSNMTGRQAAIAHMGVLTGSVDETSNRMVYDGKLPPKSPVQRHQEGESGLPPDKKETMRKMLEERQKAIDAMHSGATPAQVAEMFSK